MLEFRFFWGQDFRKMLKKQSGDVVAGWRQSLDTSEAESCDYPEFRFSGGLPLFPHDKKYAKRLIVYRIHFDLISDFLTHVFLQLFVFFPMDFHEKFRWDASEEANSMIAPEPWESQARRTLGFFSGLMKHFFLRPQQYKINKISKVKRWLNWEVKDLELIGKMVWWLTRLNRNVLSIVAAFWEAMLPPFLQI